LALSLALVGIVVMPLTSSSEAAARVRVAFELTSAPAGAAGRQFLRAPRSQVKSDTELPVHPLGRTRSPRRHYADAAASKRKHGATSLGDQLDRRISPPLSASSNSTWL
jgi:hypothetical protein